MRLSFGLVLIIILVLVVGCLLSFFWILLTPRWSFTIATNKTVYAIGENVQITVTLRNTGYLPQSITSAISDPVVVTADSFNALAWAAPWDVQISQTSYTIAPDQPLIRVFVNGTSHGITIKRDSLENTISMPVIPNAHIDEIGDIYFGSDQQFSAYTEINITAV